MLIHASKVFDGQVIRTGPDIRIEGDRVLEMGDSLSPRPGEEVMDRPEALLSPGFVDIHIHGIFGHDTMRGEAHIRAMASRLVAHGVTGFLPTTMADSLEKTRLALAGAQKCMRGTSGAAVLGCHLEGPFLNLDKKGAQPGPYIIPPTLESYRALTEGLEDAVKLITLAPELAGAEALIRRLAGRVAISAGHSAASYEQMEAAARAGITQVTHLFNAMNPLEHRAPGVPGAALTVEGLSVQLIADLMHLHAGALKLAWKAKGRDGCILITDAMEAADMPDGEYALGANRVFVHEGEARLAEGNLAGSTLTMERAVRNMAWVVGVPLADALRMATWTPAQSIGERDRGFIAPGARADLLLLDGELEVLETLIGGRSVYKR